MINTELVGRYYPYHLDNSHNLKKNLCQCVFRKADKNQNRSISGIKDVIWICFFSCCVFFCALNAVTVPRVRFLSGCVNVCSRIVGCANLSFPSGEKSQTGSWQHIQGLRLWFRVGGFSKERCATNIAQMFLIYTHTHHEGVKLLMLIWADLILQPQMLPHYQTQHPSYQSLDITILSSPSSKALRNRGICFIQVAEKGHRRLQLWH